MKDVINWLLEGESSVRYRTRLDLLNQNEDEAHVAQARRQMLEDSENRASPHFQNRYVLLGSHHRTVWYGGPTMLIGR